MAIESSPEVLNKLLSKLGAPESYQVNYELFIEQENDVLYLMYHIM